MTLLLRSRRYPLIPPKAHRLSAFKQAIGDNPSTSQNEAKTKTHECRFPYNYWSAGTRYFKRICWRRQDIPRRDPQPLSVTELGVDVVGRTARPRYIKGADMQKERAVSKLDSKWSYSRPSVQI